MDGVTVLNTITEEIHAGGFLGFGYIGGALLVLLGVLLIISNFTTRVDESLVFGILITLVGIFIVAVSYPEYGPVVGYNYSYEVTVEDGVDFNAFNEKYEIIKQRGSIYTVVEKDAD